jgi:cytochrome c553
MRLLKVLRAVLWSLIGIGRRADARELEGVRPGSVIAVGLLVAVLLVVGILTLVRLLTRDGARPGSEAASTSAPLVSARRHGPVTVRDTMEERVAACVQCHSSSTEATKDGFSPRIAGKPAGYLFNQLVSFRDGRRGYQPMVYLLQNLSDDYLREMAAYFSQLNVPYPPPEAIRLSPAEAGRARQLVEHGDPARGVPACIDCHGKGLSGIAPNIPGLLGLPRQYMNSQFGGWRSGKLRSIEPDCMGEVARRLAPEDAALIASWLAAQPVPAGLKPQSGSGRLPLECGIAKATQTASAAARSPQAHEMASRGSYLVAVGDCVACHTAIGGPAFAGGRAIETPFGRVYSTNITPDTASGIGTWSREDFWRALHEGRSKDGRLLYPAFPYPSFTQVSREDSDAIFDYLRSLPAASLPNKPHAVRFPYNSQAALAAWRALFFRAGPFEPEAKRDAEWNRGAYLVRGLGHCDACHAARNVFGAVSHSLDLGGGLIPMQNWYAPPLISAGRDGPQWHAEDLVSLLKSGVSRRGSAMGPMAEVVYRSTQHLSVADASAIASYLQSSQAEDAAQGTPPRSDAPAMERGSIVYGEHCAQCHGDRGEGAFPAYPTLVRNPSLTTPLPANAIKAVLYGGYPAATAVNPRPYGMPPYVGKLSERDIAAVVTYVRASWGNGGGPVSTLEVERFR